MFVSILTILLQAENVYEEEVRDRLYEPLATTSVCLMNGSDKQMAGAKT